MHCEKANAQMMHGRRAEARQRVEAYIAFMRWYS